MVSQHLTQPVTIAQPPKSGYGFLAAILDGLDDQPILDALQQYRRTGRKGHPWRAMWRAYIAKFFLKIRFNNQLLERLRSSRKLRDVCGFGEDVPSESAMSRFVNRLADHQDLVEQCLVSAMSRFVNRLADHQDLVEQCLVSAMSRFVNRLADHQDLVEQCLVSATGELRELVPAVKRRDGRQDQPLPPLGAVLAVDSTLFLSYSNPNRKVVSDPDARWGLKHSAKTKDGKKEWGFGYKMHLISDATHGVPLAFTITPANENDSTQLPAVLRKTLAAYPWLEPGCLLADRGYDSLPNHRLLVGLDIIPVIHIRKPTAADGLYDGVYTAEGKPACMGGEAMEYVRTDQKDRGAPLPVSGWGLPAEDGRHEGGAPLRHEGLGRAGGQPAGAGAVAPVHRRLEAPLPTTDEH